MLIGLNGQRCKAGWGGTQLLALVCFASLLVLLAPALAAAQPTGYQEYYVLGYEEHVWRAFLGIYEGPDKDVPGQICSTVSLVATADHQVIYYDHWEDGYESDLLNPVQSSTQIFGDGDASNGGAGSDLLSAGDDVNLTSDQDLASPTAINGYVPVDPARNPADIRYDGGDRIISSGGPVDLTHAMWPLENSWVGGAWEVYSRQAYAEAYSYRLPIGEDLYGFGGGDAGTYGDFRNVYLQLGAFEDNTTVLIDNGQDVVNVTIDRGWTYSSMGYINSRPAPSITVNSGTVIRSNKPTQVGLITGSDSRGGDGFQGRFLIVLSDRLWGADYVVPVPSGRPGHEAEVYLANPNDFPITVNAYDLETQATFVISPTGHISATTSYSAKRGGLGYVPMDSAARFTSSDGVFGVVVAADSSNIPYDWGFAGIPSKYLTRDYYVSWAPGTTDSSDNGSPVWVTPLSDDTTFYVDFSPLDGVADETFTLDVLQQRRVFDPDNDNTGTHIWATSEFAMAWGEDPNSSGLSTPYLDLGVTTLPLLQRWLDPVLTLDKTAVPTILPSAGGTAAFRLVANAYNSPLTNVDVTDTLPINWSYVSDSTQVTFPDGTVATLEPTRDGRNLFWDLSANLDVNQSLTLAFQAQITQTGGVDETAYDGFESGTYSGGANWTSDWQEQGDDGDPLGGQIQIVTENAPFAGSRHLRIGGTNNAVIRRVNLDGFVVPTLRFVRRMDDVEKNDRFFLDIFDGADWITVLTWSDQDLEGQYLHEIVDLVPYAGIGTAVRFRSGPGVGSKDYLYADQIEIFDRIGISVNRGQVVGTDDYSNTRFSPTDEATVYISPFSLVKSVSQAEAEIGDTLVYRLFYANLSSSTSATNVQLRDTVPIQSVTFVSASGGGVFDAVSGSIVWNLGALLPGVSGFETFAVKVDDYVEDGAVLKNVAYMRSDQTQAGSNEVRTIVKAPRLQFSKSGPTASARGKMITYTLDYNNVGGREATQVVISDRIPALTTYVPSSLAINTGGGWTPLTDAPGDDQGTYLAPTLIISPGIRAGTIEAGESGRIRFSVQVREDIPLASLILNSATLDRELDIPRESNTVVTRISDLLLSKRAEQTVVAPNGVISYTLTYENVSTTMAQSELYVLEPIPNFTSYIADTARGADRIEYSWDNGKNWSNTLPVTPVTHIRWYDAYTSTSTQESLGFAVRVNPRLPPNTTVSNVARVTSAETSRYFSGWIPSNEVTVGIVDVWVDKRVDKVSASPGEPISYTVIFGNHGSADASDAWIEDTLPRDTLYREGSIWGVGADDSGNPRLAWDVGTVAAGAGANAVGYTVVLNDGLPSGAEITNTATLRSPLGMVTSGAVTTTVDVAELSLRKFAYREEVFAGSRLDYGLLVRNTGHRAKNLVVSDTLPMNTVFGGCDCTVAGSAGDSVPVLQAGSTCGPSFFCGLERDTVVWRVGEMAGGRALQMTFWVTVDGDLAEGALVVNDSYAVAAERVPRLAGSPPVTTTVRRLNLSISKVAWPNPIRVGQQLLFTITVENQGGLLQDLTVSDVLPSGVSFEGCGGALCEFRGGTHPTVRWWLPRLADKRERDLTMRVLPLTVSGGTIVNEFYGVWVPAAGRSVPGVPVEVKVLGPYLLYLPLILQNYSP